MFIGAGGQEWKFCMELPSGCSFRKLSDGAKHRVWIASPYIGRWPAVSALLGENWWLSSTVLLRVITDINNPNNVNRGTLIRLFDRGPIRALPGIHAKIYIVDDRALVTSANLTETAFTKPWEIGILLDSRESEATITIFDAWWHGPRTIEISPDEAEKWQGSSAFASEAEEGQSLPTFWGLPQRPSDNAFSSSGTAARNFSSYRSFLQQYKDFAREYAAVQRLWANAPLFIETDTFLNYLFHEADGRPAFAFHDTRDPRRLTKAERFEELGRWAPTFAHWLLSAPDETYRVQNSQRVRTLLAKHRIDDLTPDEIRQVVDCLHCMHAQQLIRHKFLNPLNNDVHAICNAWKTLLHGNDKLEQRMQECNDALRFFGTSSVQELLGWYYPDDYPIRNSNSDAELRFFGYRV
jgi:hypothetical protein